LQHQRCNELGGASQAVPCSWLVRGRCLKLHVFGHAVYGVTVWCGVNWRCGVLSCVGASKVKRLWRPPPAGSRRHGLFPLCCVAMSALQVFWPLDCAPTHRFVLVSLFGLEDARTTTVCVTDRIGHRSQGVLCFEVHPNRCANM
jgi:hypothetical protein